MKAKFTNLDSSAELGEGIGSLLFGIGRGLGIGGGACLRLLTKSEGERRLSLVGLGRLLLLAIDGGCSLGGLSRDGGRAGDLRAQRLGSLRLGNDRSSLN